MHLTWQYPWLLLLILPTALAVIGLARRAQFSIFRTGLYVLLAAGLVSVLAAPAYLPFGDRIPVVYLIDHSDSVADFPGELQRVQPLFSGDNAATLAGWSQPQPWWLFGRDVMILAPTAADQEVQGRLGSLAAAQAQAQATLDRSASHYGGALDVLRRWAREHPPGCAVLIGDGQAQDLPEALAQAAELRQLGWSLDVMPAPEPAFDLAVVQVDTPAVTAPGQYAEVRVRVRANAAGVGQVQIELLDRDGKSAMTDRRDLTFTATGEEDITFGVRLERPAVYRVIARVGARPADGNTFDTFATDGQPGNDFGFQLLVVQSRTVDILHVVDDTESSALGIQLRHMATTVPALGWSYTALTPKRFAAIGAVPRKTRLLILDNLDRAAFPEPVWRSVNEYVQVEGGGLLAVGGKQAFGAGGHRPDEPFERCLPIRMEPPKNRRIDVVLIIDISASMADTIVESAVKSSKLEAAKLAVWGLLGGKSLLGDDDRIALLSFSDEARLQLPFTPVREALAIKQTLAGLQAEGATRPAPAVEQAFQLVADSQAEKVFIVFVSDGQPSSAGTASVDFASGQNNRIIELLKQHIDADGKRTFWPIFIGDSQGTEPYRRTLADFARYGHGRLIWPQSAGNRKPGDNEVPTLLEALRAILDEGNQDRFVSAKPFQSVPATVTAHPLAAELAAGAQFAWRNRVGSKPDADLLWQARDVAAMRAGADTMPAGADTAPAARQPEPLFAAGQYGNGRSVALAQPLNDLLIAAREKNPRMANQLIDWVQWLTAAREPATARGDLRPADADCARALGIPPGQACLYVELFGEERIAVTGLQADLRAIPLAADSALDGGTPAADPPRAVSLTWLAPGRFAGVWPDRSPQAALYAVALTATADRRGPAHPAGRLTIALPPSAEYLQSGVDRRALQTLATAGGGQLLEGSDAPAQWRWRVETQWRAARAGRIAREGQDLRPWLAALLITLVLLDSGVRWIKRAPATAAADHTQPVPAVPPAESAAETSAP